MAKFTVYLPDDLRRRGIEAELNFSELLRYGVIEALRSREGAGEGDTPAPSDAN